MENKVIMALQDYDNMNGTITRLMAHNAKLKEELEEAKKMLDDTIEVTSIKKSQYSSGVFVSIIVNNAVIERNLGKLLSFEGKDYELSFAKTDAIISYNEVTK